MVTGLVPGTDVRAAVEPVATEVEVPRTTLSHPLGPVLAGLAGGNRVALTVESAVLMTARPAAMAETRDIAAPRMIRPDLQERAAAGAAEATPAAVDSVVVESVEERAMTDSAALLVPETDTTPARATVAAAVAAGSLAGNSASARQPLMRHT